MKKKRKKWLYVVFAVLGSVIGTSIANMFLGKAIPQSGIALAVDYIASGIGTSIGCLIFIRSFQKEEKNEDGRRDKE